MMSRAADRLFHLFFPPRCPLCDRVVPAGEEICPSCRASVAYEIQPRCMKCGRSLGKTVRRETDNAALGVRKEEGRVYCPDCERHPHAYDFGYCLARYHSVARGIYRMKYAGRRENAKWFGKEIVRCLGEEIRRLDPEVLVPVPLHRTRLRKRGYNQAADLAYAISALTGIPVREDLVERKVNTTPMKRSDNEQKRRNNMKNAFQLRTDDVKYKRIVLVDDIYTSGSTVDALAVLFRRAGVSGIWFVAVAGAHL